MPLARRFCAQELQIQVRAWDRGLIGPCRQTEKGHYPRERIASQIRGNLMYARLEVHFQRFVSLVLLKS